jgi:hypothetical protein
MMKCLALLAFVAVAMLSGCTAQQQARAAKIEHNIKTGVKIADEALGAVDAIVNVAAPGSTAAKNLNNATVTAQKVDGVVQSVTIAIPVDPAATTPAPVPNGN